MAGHSKWAQIKRKKAVADATKGAVFGKLAQAITVAARGNPDPETNLRLRGEIDRAHAANMPSESIQRAVNRGADRDSAELMEVQVEFIGPGGAAIIVRAITDNHNRTINGLRTLAESSGARMVTPGSLAWMFRKGHEVVCSIDDPAVRDQLKRLLDGLENHDDVQDVIVNADISTP